MEPGVFFYWFFIYWGTWSENNHLHIDEPIGCDEVKNHFRLQRKRGRPRKDNSRTTDRDPDYKPDATVINATDSKSSAHGDKAKVCCFLSPLIIQTTMSLVRLITGWSFSRHLCMMTLSHVTHSWQWVRSTWYDSCCNAARAVPLQEPKDALNDAPILQWLMVTSHTLSVVIARSAFSSYPPPPPVHPRRLSLVFLIVLEQAWAGSPSQIQAIWSCTVRSVGFGLDTSRTSGSSTRPRVADTSCQSQSTAPR